MKGPYYCNGEIPNCQYKDHCYKNGGTCYHTIYGAYAGKKPPNIRELQKKRHDQAKELQQQQKCRPTINHQYQQQGMAVTVIASIISAFATALIVTLAKML